MGKALERPLEPPTCAYGPQYRHFNANTSRQGKGTVDNGMWLVVRSFRIAKNRYYHITFTHTHTLTQNVFLYLDANTSPRSLRLGFQESCQRVSGDLNKNNRSSHPHPAFKDVRILKTVALNVAVQKSPATQFRYVEPNICGSSV